MTKRVRITLGDVYAIPLPDGRFAFGRVFKETGLAVYKHIGEGVQDLPDEEEYQFTVSVYKDVLKSGNWPRVDCRPFKTEEEKWLPPMYVKDQISGSYSIYHKGQFQDSTEVECRGLEEAAVWDAHHIVDRIMGDDRWHR